MEIASAIGGLIVCRDHGARDPHPAPPPRTATSAIPSRVAVARFARRCSSGSWGRDRAA